jgi:Zn-dependent peptidase ImmA (M78 family)
MSRIRVSHPRLLARAIIDEFNITCPEQIQLEDIAADRGVFARETTLTGADARLVSIPGQNKAVASINSLIPEEGRRRFALAHELGHFELHRSATPRWDCTEADFLKWYKEASQEPEANEFAAELLMPERIFACRCTGKPPSFNLLSSLAFEFRTSITSTAIRYAQFGNHPCAIIAVKASKLAWFSKSEDFYPRVRQHGSPVDPDSVAGEFSYQGKMPPERAEQVPRSTWLEEQSRIGTAPLYEICIAMPRYQSSISIIWEP